MEDSLQQAIWNPKDGCKVWFPHLAKIKNGRYVSGSSTVNWKNYFEDDGNTIIQMLYPDEKVNDNDKEPIFRKDIAAMHTFMKMDDKDYRYVGTFMLDLKSSTTRYQIVRKIKDSIDLSIWASGHDMSYFDFSEIGTDVFKDFYIKRNYREHKKCVDSFCKNDTALLAEEEFFNNEKASFLSKYSIAVLSRMPEEQFSTEYIPFLSKTLNNIYGCDYNEEKIKGIVGSLMDFGRVLSGLLYDDQISVNEKIRKCIWGNTLAAQIYTLYDENSEEYLYTLNEKEIDKILYAIGVPYNDSDDVVEKQSKIYFWKYCDNRIVDWSSFRLYQFLRFMANLRKREIKYITPTKPDVSKRIITEANIQEEEIEKDELLSTSSDFAYNSMPRLREININAKPSQGAMIPRHQDRKINALIKANYLCEIDNTHPTFKRRNSDKNYTETHHLIPLEYSGQFQYTLDTEENIVSLCSNCHNQIHYGAGAEELISKLYEERKQYLINAGLSETIDGIKIDLDQLLHMYNLD